MAKLIWETVTEAVIAPPLYIVEIVRLRLVPTIAAGEHVKRIHNNKSSQPRRSRVSDPITVSPVPVDSIQTLEVKDDG